MSSYVYYVNKSNIIADFYYIHRNDKDFKYVGTIGFNGAVWTLRTHESEVLDTSDDFRQLRRDVESGKYQFSR